MLRFSVTHTMPNGDTFNFSNHHTQETAVKKVKKIKKAIQTAPGKIRNVVLFLHASNPRQRKKRLEDPLMKNNSALIETLSNELEKLRPMETALEIAEADNKKYIARIKELEAENERLTIDERNAELRADVADATVEKLKSKNEDIDYQRKQLSRLCAIKENEIKELIDKIQDLKVIVSQKEDVINKLVDKAKKERNSAQRAMWLMTEEWAEAMGLASCNIANKFMSRENFEVNDDYRNETIKKYRHRQVVFYKYGDYCKNKAKEYKL